MGLRVKNYTGSPCDSAKEKKRDGSRKDEEMQGQNSRHLLNSERQYLAKSARAVDVSGLLDMLNHPTHRRERHDGRQQRHDDIKSKEDRRRADQAPLRREQEWQEQKSRHGVFGQYVAIPDQEQLRKSHRQQHGEPA